MERLNMLALAAERAGRFSILRADTVPVPAEKAAIPVVVEAAAAQPIE